MQAHEALTTLIKDRTVFLSEVEADKYGQRFVAAVQTAEGVDVAGELLKRGLAASYEGKGPKHDWCAE